MKSYSDKEKKTIATGVVIDELKKTGEFDSVEEFDESENIIYYTPSGDRGETKEFLEDLFNGKTW